MYMRYTPHAEKERGKRQRGGGEEEEKMRVGTCARVHVYDRVLARLPAAPEQVVRLRST